MKKLIGANNLRAKSFYILTLFSVLFLVQVFYANTKNVTEGSLHLSSSATAVNAAITSTPVQLSAPQVERYYDVRIRLVSPVDATKVTDNGDGNSPTLTPVRLKAGTEVMVTVPGSAFGGIAEPKNLGPHNVNSALLRQMVASLDNVLNDPPYVGRQEAIVTKTFHRDRALRSETVRLPLRSLAEKRGIRFAGIEENEDIDYSAEEEEETSNEEKTALRPFSFTQGGVLDCSLTNNCPNKAVTDSRSFVNNLMNLFSRDLSFDEFKGRYESSREVSELLSAARKGYTATRRSRNGRPRYSHPKDGVVVPGQSIGACYNGVKTLLAKAGWIDSVSSLPGIPANSAGAQLKRNNFVNLLEDPRYKEKIQNMSDIPVGAVVVYEGHGPNRGKRDPGYKYGHIEVKTAQGYISDYFSTNARTGEGLVGNYRKVIGVYVKSGVSTNHRLAQAGQRE